MIRLIKIMMILIALMITNLAKASNDTDALQYEGLTEVADLLTLEDSGAEVQRTLNEQIDSLNK